MFQFLESIAWVNGEMQNLAMHQQRVNQTFAKFYPEKSPWDLKTILAKNNFPKLGKFKLRMVYNHESYQVSCQEYIPKIIHQLVLKEAPNLNYAYKFTNREAISDLVPNSAHTDVIITQNQLITDASYANLVFWDGEKWYTPSLFLLNGTKRQTLLQNKIIYEKQIHVDDLKKFTKVSLINALLDIDELSVPIEKIIYSSP